MELERLGGGGVKPEGANGRLLKPALAVCVCLCAALLLAVILGEYTHTHTHTCTSKHLQINLWTLMSV